LQHAWDPGWQQQQQQVQANRAQQQQQQVVRMAGISCSATLVSWVV
jgi:hypothetical protein